MPFADDSVRGLTTAATLWLTAAVGMAAGSGLCLLATLVTAGHFLIVFACTPLAAALPQSRYASTRLRVSYLDRRGTLRAILTECTSRGCSVHEMALVQHDTHQPEAVTVTTTISGGRSLGELTAAVSEFDGALTVTGGGSDHDAQ